MNSNLPNIMADQTPTSEAIPVSVSVATRKKPPPSVVTPAPPNSHNHTQKCNSIAPRFKKSGLEYDSEVVDLEETLQPVLELVWPEIYYSTCSEREEGDKHCYGISIHRQQQQADKKGVFVLLDFLLVEMNVVEMKDLAQFGDRLDGNHNLLSEEQQIWTACWQSALTPVTWDSQHRLDSFCAICQLIKLMDDLYVVDFIAALQADDPDISARAILDAIRDDILDIHQYNIETYGNEEGEDLLYENADKKIPSNMNIPLDDGDKKMPAKRKSDRLCGESDKIPARVLPYPTTSETDDTLVQPAEKRARL